MRLIIALAKIITILLLISGCDTWSYIRKSDRALNEAPKIGCVETTLEKLESVDFESYDVRKSSTLDGATIYNHFFSYRLKKLPSYGDGYDRAHVVFSTGNEKKSSYTNEFRKHGTRSISKEESSIINSTMKEVEESLSKNCSLVINSSTEKSELR